jgi:hypothetical protein
MLLSHIGKQKEADLLERALDICMFEEKKLTITGRDNGATCSDFGDYVMETVKKHSTPEDLAKVNELLNSAASKTVKAPQ